MLQTYWGAGRTAASTDAVSLVRKVALAYDLVYNARDADGKELWTAAAREKVERDLILEWAMGAEPSLGGPGKADLVHNKAPRMYSSIAAVGRVLNLPNYVEVALAGFRAVRNNSFLYDGFSKESPSYTNMYLTQLVWIPETLDGFTWPTALGKKDGQLNLYTDDKRLEQMYRQVVDGLGPDGRFLPLADTFSNAAPETYIVDIGLHRYKQFYAGRLNRIASGGIAPTHYAVFNLNERTLAQDQSLASPEIYFPAWMTAIMRHGVGPDATVLSLTFSPPGGHRHRDNLALYYACDQQVMLGDHGYANDSIANHWIRSSYSHNLLIVDDQEQLFRDENPRKPAFGFMTTSPKASVVEASSRVYSQCSQYRRTVALIKGPANQTFAVDIFRVAGGAKHALRVHSQLAASDSVDGRLVFDGLPMPVEQPLPDYAGSNKREDIFGLRDTRLATDAPEQWQAQWQQKDRRYRLWCLTPASSVAASHGPGQQSNTDAGRRFRYVDIVREGPDLVSTFVAVHEPSLTDMSFPIRNVHRYTLPDQTGAQAVALRIDSDWGTYYLFSDCAELVEIDGVAFQGKFGIMCTMPDKQEWLLTSGAQTLKKGDYGFADQPAHWAGPVQSSTESVLNTTVARPTNWPTLPVDCQNHVIVHDGNYQTGFPVVSTTGDTITVNRFGVPPVSSFELPAMQYRRK